MKYYAVIDTNVLVSAMLRWDSVLGCVLEHAIVTPREMLTILESE